MSGIFENGGEKEPPCHVLIITDHLFAHSWVSKVERTRSIQRNGNLIAYHVLPLGICKEAYRLHNDVLLKKISRYSFVNIETFSENAQQEVRDFFPSFVYRLGHEKIHQGKSLLDLFETKDANLWWLLEFTEKSAYQIPLINQLYYLSLIRKVIETNCYDEMWLALDDRLLGKCIQQNFGVKHRIQVFPARWLAKLTISQLQQTLKSYFFINVILTLAKELCMLQLRRLVIWFRGLSHVQSCRERHVTIFSFYPIWWSRPFSQEASEWFFGASRHLLERVGGLVFVVWTHLNPFYFLKISGQLKQIFNEKKIVPLESFLSLKDCVQIFSLQFIQILLKFKFFFYRQIKAYYFGSNASILIRQELQSSLASQTLIQAMMIQRAYQNYLERFDASSALLFRNEFQPCERAILYAAKKRSKTIGFQHSSIGRNHLPYFFAPGEIESYETNVDGSHYAMPLPSHFLLSGLKPREFWKENGFRESNFSVCGPARFPQLFQTVAQRSEKIPLRTKLQLPHQQTIFLVAFTILWREIINCLAFLIESVDAEIAADSHFLLKCHPSTDFQTHIEKMLRESKSLLSFSFLKPNVESNDYLMASDAIVSCGSTICLEAIAMGVMPIVIHDFSRFSVNPMVEFKNASLFVGSSKDFGRALKLIIKKDAQLNQIRSNWPVAIQQAFHRLDQDPALTLSKTINQLVSVNG